jgi:predicted nucleic acid-binding Zn ribbon protein
VRKDDRSLLRSEPADLFVHLCSFHSRIFPYLSRRSPTPYNTVMTSSHRARPALVGDVLKERIDALGWEGRLREEKVLTNWDAAVGPQIAAHARPSHITDRRLTIVTESPVWTQQLSLLKPDLLRRIAKNFGPGVVTDLFFITGKFEPAPENPPAAARRPAVTTIPAALESDLAGIPDAEVRDSVRRLMLASLATRDTDEADIDPP